MSMRLQQLVETSNRVAKDSSRLRIIEYLSECLKKLPPDEIEIGIAYLSGEIRQGKIGVGYSSIRKIMADTASSEPGLTLKEIDSDFLNLANAKGSGSNTRKLEILREMMRRATRNEQDFLIRL